MIPAAAPRIYGTLSRALAPRVPLSASEWADSHVQLSSKNSSLPGQWRTDRNPPLREPMDCLSARSTVHEIVCKFPIQYGKSALLTYAGVGYTMDHDPCPIMVLLPGEVSMNKWIAQKLNPLIEETPCVRQALTSVATRDTANQRTFKDFAGGQLYVEHAGSPTRLKSTTVRKLLVDEIDQILGALRTGDDPVELARGRVSSFPSNYQILFVGTPELKGTSRIDALYESSDQRRYYVPCPHCGHEQPLEWRQNETHGLMWSPDGSRVWYTCRENGCVIEEHHKTAMIAKGRWVAENPGAKIRGYTLNCLYYPFGLGPRWPELVAMWRDAQNDPAKLKTFVNDRLAEAWEDPAMRQVKHNVISERAEPYRLRTAPRRVLVVTAGVDTQDDRLECQIVGWGRGMAAWTLDYVRLPGDPDDPDVWLALTDLLNRPIEHELGGVIQVAATAIDTGGHRTEAVKNYVRTGVIRRPMAIFGAVPNNAPVLGKPKLVDINWQGKLDKRGVHLYAVGTVQIKHTLYRRLAADHDKKDPELRMVRFSDELEPEYFGGLTSETYNPAKNRFEKKRGPRNEPLDTWGYAYAAAHHPKVRLHRYTNADWDAAEARLIQQAAEGQRQATAGGAAPSPRETPNAGAARSPIVNPFTGKGYRGFGS